MKTQQLRMLAWLLALCCLAPTAALGTDTLEHGAQWLLSFKAGNGQSYHQQNGYTEAACQPDDFLTNITAALRHEDFDKRKAELQKVLLPLGFDVGDEGPLSLYGLSHAEKTQYGRLPSPWGEARITAVMISGNGTYLYFIFTEKPNGWHLTDCLTLDYWAAEYDGETLPLIKHGLGKPGAWLITGMIGHGTGVFFRAHQWYNVFSRAYDFTYVLEGFDTYYMDTEVCDYIGWQTDTSVTGQEVGDVIRFITYTGVVRNPFEEELPLGEELYSAMTLYEYRYDAATASFLCTLEEERTLMNPGAVYAAGFLRYPE